MWYVPSVTPIFLKVKMLNLIISIEKNVQWHVNMLADHLSTKGEERPPPPSLPPPSFPGIITTIVIQKHWTTLIDHIHNSLIHIDPQDRLLLCPASKSYYQKSHQSNKNKEYIFSYVHSFSLYETRISIVFATSVILLNSL